MGSGSSAKPVALFFRRPLGAQPTAQRLLKSHTVMSEKPQIECCCLKPTRGSTEWHALPSKYLNQHSYMPLPTMQKGLIGYQVPRIITRIFSFISSK